MLSDFNDDFYLPNSKTVNEIHIKSGYNFTFITAANNFVAGKTT